MGVILLTEKDVKDLLTMKDAIEVCEKTFANWGEGKVVCPAKVTLELGEDAEWPPFKNGLNAMPAYIDWMNSAGIKCIGGSLNNPSQGLPYIIALILLFSPKTGIFKAIMDGEQITNYRTGAQAAIAAKHLSGKKTIRLGIIGAGAQGRTQLKAFNEVFSISNLAIYDISSDASKRYVEEMSSQVNSPIEIQNNPREVFEKSDVVVSVSHGRDKFIKNDWLRPGQIVLPMGSFTECEDKVFLDGKKVIVDHPEQALHRGSLKSVVDQGKFSHDDLYGTIGEIVAGKKPGRESEEEIIVCIPIGTGAMDVSCATFVYEKALKEGRGSPFDFNVL